jgi:hypothetical protein
VTTYTITITPDDSSAMTTTLRLDTAGGDVTLTDLHLHKGSGLSTGELPAIDYGMLLQAVTPSSPTPILPAAAQEIEAAPAPQPAVIEAAPVPAPRQRAARPTRSARSTRSAAAQAPAAEPAPVVAATEPAATPRAARSTRSTRGTGRRAATKTAAPAETEATAPKSRARRTAPAKTTAQSGADATKAKKTAKSAPAKKATRATSAGERAYRRMPDDFSVVFQQAGNAAAVADHYSVPRHTAHGWIRRLREQDTTTTNR